MAEYREIAPSAERIGSIECLWSIRQEGTAGHSRVIPDGCADILFTRNAGSTRLEVVGPMTRYADYTLPAGQLLAGARFRPGAWRGLFGIPGDRITDRVLPLEEFWGSRSRELMHRLAEAETAEDCARLLHPPPAEPTPVAKAIQWMERRGGCVSMDDLARHCGWSPRQLRRIFLEQTGLGPKFLARVFRFRRAAARIAGADFAGLALDCGYYDQAHLIRDFQQLAGQTPAAYVNGRFFQSRRGQAAVASRS